MYNAVVGITGEYELYRWNALAPKGASPEAAAAAAADRVLDTYMGKLEASARRSMRRSPLPWPEFPMALRRTRASVMGSAAADHIIAMRAGDGRDAAVTVPDATEPGDWAPTPPGFLPFASPWYAGVDPLLIDSPTQFAPGPPPPINSDLFTSRSSTEVLRLRRAEPDSCVRPSRP